MQKASYIKQTRSGRAFDCFNILFLFLFCFIMVYPFINVLALAFNEGTDAARGGIYFFPRRFSLQNFGHVFSNKDLLRATSISVMRVAAGTCTGVLCSAMLGYIVTCRHFAGRKFLRVLFIITMYFNGGLIPTYLLMLKLGFNNTFNVYWVPSLFSAFYMILVSSYIQELPEAVFESARIDGAPEITIFFKIVIPLCVPMLACIAIYIGANQWNSWFDVNLYSKNGKWDNLQILLYRLLNQATALREVYDQSMMDAAVRTLHPITIRAAITVVVTFPILMIYPFFQKYFVSGITVGAVKQ